ncbi:MAG: hypothetical protein LQ351_006304 [Letrouitia transgressa]|nr:MAG: hypothetical protein LQ351_006304 [Letrouitia transgressa]
MSSSASASHHYKFNVKMTCGGCSGAVDRVLKRIPGIEYTVSLENQTADVYVSEKASEEASYETVLEKIKKTGKTVVRAERDGVEAPV